MDWGKMITEGGQYAYETMEVAFGEIIRDSFEEYDWRTLWTYPSQALRSRSS